MLKRADIAAVIAAAAIIVCALMVRPIIGIADNGDFARIMGVAGLNHIEAGREDRYFGYVSREYAIENPIMHFSGYFSTQVLIVWKVLMLNRLILNQTVFDIRLLSFLYSAVFLVSLFMAVRYVRRESAFTGWVAAFVSLFIFADLGYLSYFNSLYGEPVSFCLILLMVAAAAFVFKDAEPKIRKVLPFFIASVFIAGAKAQYLPVGFIAALFAFRLRHLYRTRLWRLFALVFSAAVVIVSAAVYLSTPGEIKNCNKYNTVFYGILKDSPHPEKDLEELGVDGRYSVLAGTEYFAHDKAVDIKAPGFEKDFYKRVNHLKVILFYIKHPGMYVDKLRRAAECGFAIRHGYGNYEKHPEIEFRQTVESFILWSNLKAKVFPRSLEFVAFYFLAAFTVLFAMRAKEKSIPGKVFLEVFMLVGLIGLTQFAVPVIGDGEADLGRHMFLFNVCFDILFAAGIILLTSSVVRGLKAGTE
jgi:hypothetical protein